MQSNETRGGTTLRAPRPCGTTNHTATMTNTTTDQEPTEAQTTNTIDARPLRDVSKFQRDLLRTITALDEPSGVDIQDALESAYGEEITHPRIYMAINGLVESGFVEKGRIDYRTNSYALTDEGERAFSAHLRWLCSTATGGAD